MTCRTSSGRPLAALVRRLLPVVLVAAAAGGGCGKKGPPLAPLVKVPAAPEDVAARRVGGAVDLQLRVPAANSDNTRPGNVGRVEVFAFTGKVPSSADLVKHGTLVATMPVRKPPEEDEQKKKEKEKTPRSRGEAATAGAGRQKPPKPSLAEAAPIERPPASMENGFDQGDLVVVAEAIGDAQLTPNAVTPPKRPPVAPPEPWQPLLEPKESAEDARHYFVVGVNHDGRRGSFSPPQSVPLGPVPEPPAPPLLAYDETNLTIWWAAPRDAPRPVQEPAEEGMLESTPRVPRPAQAAYNVYEVPAAFRLLPPAVSARPALGELPKPLNEKAVADTSVTRPIGPLGQERCFVVSMVVEWRGRAVESLPSAPACGTLADLFPPAAPKGVAAVGSEGAISLIWDANAEPDLAGYLVLRREAGAERATQVTPEPIKETTFRDTAVAKGVRYTYTVVAVDAAGNRSAPSEGVEEGGR